MRMPARKSLAAGHPARAIGGALGRGRSRRARHYSGLIERRGRDSVHIVDLPSADVAREFIEREPYNRLRPCSSALGPPHRADRGDRAQVLDQHPVDGESTLA